MSSIQPVGAGRPSTHGYRGYTGALLMLCSPARRIPSMASPEPQHIQKNLSCSTKAFAVLRPGLQPLNPQTTIRDKHGHPKHPLALLKDPSLLKTAALVNGQWLDGSSRFDVNDPPTGLKLGRRGQPRPGRRRSRHRRRQRRLGPPGRPRPPRNAAPSCANGLTCSWPTRTTWRAS